jgi:hypothetical protein
MRALAVAPSPGERSSWERLLVETVRTEFRVEVVIARKGSPLLGAGCAVAGCTSYGYHRPWGRGTGRALCALHGDRWRAEGRPEIDGWVARARLPRALRAVRVCEIAGCPRSSHHGGRCRTHEYLAARPPETGDGSCRVGDCQFPAEPGRLLCDAHQERFRVRGQSRPLSIDEFVELIRAERELAAGAYVLPPVDGALRLELQYLLQHEADVGRQVNPRRFNDLVGLVAGERVASLLSREEDEWRRVAEVAARPYAGLGVLAAYARERLCELRDGVVDPWAPDRWRIARLPLGADYAHDKTRMLDFGAIRCGWLRELLKRWARYRLQSGTLAPQGVSHALCSFKELERFCELSGIELADAEQFSRRLLEEFLDHVAGLPLARNSKHALLRHVKVVLDDVDRHGWVRFARDARYFRDELPSQRHSLPRFIDEAVMRQLENEDVLARLGDETTITAVVMLMETGLRSQDANVSVDSKARPARRHVPGAAHVSIFPRQRCASAARPRWSRLHRGASCRNRGRNPEGGRMRVHVARAGSSAIATTRAGYGPRASRPNPTPGSGPRDTSRPTVRVASGSSCSDPAQRPPKETPRLSRS